MAEVVVQVVQHLRPGGIETMALDLIDALPNSKLVSLEGSYEEAVSHWPRLSAYRGRLHFLGKPSGWSLKTVMKLAKLLRSWKASAVHTHHIGPLIYGGAAARLAGVSSIVHTEHDAWHLEDPRRARLAKICFAAIRPQVVCDARKVKENFTRYVGRDAAVIINGIDTDRFQPSDKVAARTALSLPHDIKLIGTAGRLEAVKNQAMLLKAFAEIAPNTAADLVIAGDGSQMEDLKALAKDLGITTRVFFLGRIDTMPTFYNAIDLFVLPSLKEGFPLSLLEAQACNVPVIATNTGATSEAVCPSTGKVIPNDDSAACSRALSSAIRSATAVNPRDFVLKSGSFTRMLLEYTFLYRGRG